MKKLILVFTACAFFIACNNGAANNAAPSDSTSISSDSAAAPSTMDRYNKMSADSNSRLNADSAITH